MLNKGIVSVSFRKLTPEEIVREVKACGLKTIEWGSDVHVPAGDIETAKRVRELTESARLSCGSYGTYFNEFVDGVASEDEVAKYILSAEALGVTDLRIWPGNRWSWEASPEYYDIIVRNAQLACDLAKEKGMNICFEYHRHSLTDNRFAAGYLLERVGRDNAKLYWQYDPCQTHAENLMGLKMALPHLTNVHVQFGDCYFNLLDLKDGRKLWKDYMKLINSTGRDHNLYLEFVKGNTIEQLKKDAKTLLKF